MVRPFPARFRVEPMSFLFRAALVIGALSWMALQRQGAATPNLVPSLDRPALAQATLAAWETLPDAAREALLREGGAEIARRAGGLVATAPVSRDTLMESDRKLPWRGAQIRADAARLSERGERSAP